jgi:hypothetical protein
VTMPQGPTGIEATAWGAEWITTNSASEFHDRTRSAVETHYKTTLTGTSTTSALQPWTTARDALFQTLMSGFSSLNAFIGMLSGAIAGAVGGTLTTIANFMTGLVSDVGKLLTALLNAAGEFIGDIGKGLVDGVVTVAGWLNNLWMTLTGQTGTGKKVSDVSTALSTVTSNANTGKQVAETARDNLNITWNELYDGLDGTTTPVGTQRNATQLKGRGAAVRASAIIGEGYYYAGANILINPGFEDTAFAILNQGVAVTSNVATGDVARSGTRSLRLVAAAGNPFSYLSANTTSQVYLPCTEGETYYFECWVRGKSTNTQATAANGIVLGITTYDSAKANPQEVIVSFPAGTSYNADWVKVSGKLLVPLGKSFFTPFVRLNSSTVTNGHTYYFDDVVVREVTDATIADAKAVATNTALYNSPTPLTTVLASAVPQIDGSKINTGTLAEDRIASLSQAKVTGLTTDLGLISTKARDNANLVAGSDFEATTLPWNTAVGYFAVDTAVFNSGTKSLKITGGAIANNTIVYGNGAGTTSLFEVKAGEQFYMELWARRSSDYVNDSTTGPRFRLVRSVGTTIGDILLRVTDIPVADTWVKLTKLVTVPSDGTTAIGFHFSGPPANAAGSVWVDDIVVRRVVVPDAVAALPQSKVPDLWNDLYDGLGGTTGSTGITSAQVRARGATVRGSAKIGEAVYLSASNLLINPSFEDTTFAILNNGVASTDVARSGTRSLRLIAASGAPYSMLAADTTGQVYLPCVPTETYYLECWVYGKTTNTQTSAVNGLIFGIQAYTASKVFISNVQLTFNGGTSRNGGWAKLSGKVQVPANAAFFTPFIQLSSGVLTNGETYYFDDVVVREVTDAAIADGKAVVADGKAVSINQALYNADTPAAAVLASSIAPLDSSKITTGNFAQARVTNLTTDLVAANNAASAADTKAVTASGMLTTRIQAGDNLASDPGWENVSFALTAPGGTAAYSTEQKRGGSRSLKVTTVASSYCTPRLFRDAAGEIVIPVIGNEVYYLEAWVFGHASNQNTTGRVWFQFGGYDASGTATAGGTAGHLVVGTALSGWTKFSGYLTMPATAIRATFFIVTENTIPAGNIYYFDDAVVYNHTEVVKLNQALYLANTPGTAVLSSKIQDLDASKITGGVLTDGRIPPLAQAKITGLGTDLGAAKSIGLTALAKGSNLASNPGFESDNVYIGVNASGVFSTAQKRSGTRSFKMTGYTYRDLFANETANVRTACNAGDVYYLEIWVYGEATNVTNGSQVWLQADCYNSSGVRTEFFGPGGTTVPGLVLTNAQSSATRGVWTQISGYLTIPANTVDFTVTMVQTDPSNTVGGAFSYYWDDFKCFRVTESATTNQALYSANVPAATILASKVPPIDGSKINTGTLSEDRIASLSAGKITSGTFVEGRIPELAQAKITGLGTDLGNRVDYTAYAAYLSGGTGNLVTNPSFEDTTQYINAATYSTAYARSGTRSAKIVGTASNVFLDLVSNKTGPVYINGAANSKFYLECYVRADPANTILTGATVPFNFSILYYTTANVYINSVGISATFSQIGNGTNWFQLSGIVTLPNDSTIAKIRPMIFTTATGNGQSYYFDDVDVKEITESVDINQALYAANIPGPVVLSNKIQDLDASKITGGVLTDGRIPSLAAGKITSGTFGSTLIPELAQAKITSLQDDLAARSTTDSADNLCNNPGFETAGLYTGVNATRANDAAPGAPRTGSWCAKVTQVASAYSFIHPIVNRSGSAIIPTSPGDVYYFECWIKGLTANAAAPGGIIWLQTTYWLTGGTTSNNALTTVPANNYHNNGWTFYSGYLPAMPVDVYQVQFYLAFSNNLPGGNIYYVDDMKLYRVTDQVKINQALYTANIPGPVVLSSKIQDLDASKITGGTLADGRIPSLAAGKITSGTFGSTLIPTLDRSKLLNPDFSNALQDGGFETGTNGTSTGSWGTSGGGVIATIADPKVGGTKVLSVASSGAILDTNMLPTIPVSPGEVWYGECWVRKTTAGGTGTYQLGSTVAKDGGGLQYPSFLTADVSTLTQNVWTKISGFITIPDAINQLTVRPSVRNSVAAGTTIQFDNVVVRKATQYELADSAVTGAKIAALAVDNGKIADLAVTGEKTTGLDGSKITSGSVPEANIAQLSQAKVTGLPDTLLPVSQTLIEHAQDIVDLKAAREVTVNQGKTISVSFVQLPNSNDLPTTGSQTWSTQYLTGSGPTFGITSGKAAWKSSGTRTAKVLYRGAGTRQVFVSGTGGTFTLTVGANTTAALAWNASAATVQTALTGLASVGANNATVTGTITTLPGLAITLNSGLSGALSLASSVTGGVATLSDGGETTLTDYQSLRGVLADPPGIFGNESSGFTALARVSQDSNSYVFARAYWASLGNLRGKIGYANNVGGTAVETVWQDNIPLTWSTELTFRLGVDDNPRAYQVFSGTTLVTRYDEGYTDFAALTAITSKATGRTYVDNTGNRLTVTGTGGTFTLTVGGVTTTAIAFNATAATVATALNTALNTALATTGVVYATVTGTAANTAGSPGGLVAKFSSKVPGLTIGNANLTVNAASITGGTATVANRYTWSGTAFVPSAATSGAGAASPLGPTSRRFGAEVRTSGSNASGTISSVAVSDNPPVVYAGSVARMSRLSTGNVGSLSTTDTALPNNFFDDVDFESLDIDASLSTGSFTVTKSKMYLVTARVKLREAYAANLYLNLQVWDGGYSTYNLTQRGGSLWPADAGNFSNPSSGFVLTGTWLQYLTAGSSVRLSANCDRNSYTTAFTGGTLETYFSISALQ